MTDCEQITYRFHLPQGVRDITLRFDPDSFELRQETRGPLPDWSRLDFHQCPACPLRVEQSPACPFAGALAGLIEEFDQFYSYDEAIIEVVGKNRTVVAKKPLQHGIASLMGLVGATSGCPHLAYFRPMARFHLPFARDDETLYRVFSMFLLSRFLHNDTVELNDHAFDELEAQSRTTCDINHAMAERMRAAFARDVAINAVVVLDSFAQAVPFVISADLDELRAMFAMMPAPGAP